MVENPRKRRRLPLVERAVRIRHPDLPMARKDRKEPKQPGPGRPRVMKNGRPITVRIEEEHYQQLRWMAFEAGHDKPSIAARDVIAAYLKEHPPARPTPKRG